MNRVTLGDVAIEYKDTREERSDGCPVVGLEHLTPGTLTLSAWDSGNNGTFTKRFRKGQILFGRRRAYLKKAAVAPFDGICSGDITVIEAKPERVLPALLPFAIQNHALFDFAVEKSAGSLSPRVKWEHLRNYEFRLPDPDKQERLAETLWSIVDAQDAYRNLLSATDELVSAQFIEMFGKPKLNNNSRSVKPMTSLCEIIDGDRGKNYPKAEDFSDVGYCLFLNAKNVTNKGFNFDSCMFITEEKDKALRTGKLQRGDIVLTTRGTVGNLAFYTEKIPFDNVRINSGMVILRLNRTLVNEVFFIEQFKTLLPQVKRGIVSGSAQPQLPISAMNKIKILLPEIDIQERFAAFVEQADKSKLALRQALADLNATYKRIIAENLC